MRLASRLRPGKMDSAASHLLTRDFIAGGQAPPFRGKRSRAAERCRTAPRRDQADKDGGEDCVEAAGPGPPSDSGDVRPPGGGVPSTRDGSPGPDPTATEIPRSPARSETAVWDGTISGQHGASLRDATTLADPQRVLEVGLGRQLLQGSRNDLSSGLTFDTTRFSSLSQVSGCLAPESLASLSASTSSSNVSGKPFCRICLEDDKGERDLIAPCKCLGSLTYLHRTCLEKWLEVAKKTYCELCGCQFHVVVRSKPFRQWLVHSLHQRVPHNLWLDLAIFIVVSAMAAAAVGLCLTGAVHLMSGPTGHEDGPSLAVVEGLGLMALTTVLIFFYLLWVKMSIRYYYLTWETWRLRTHNLTVQPPPEKYKTGDVHDLGTFV